MLTLTRSFSFDAEPEPDFSDSDPENDDSGVRAFNQEVLADAQAEVMDEAGLEVGSQGLAGTNDAVELLEKLEKESLELCEPEIEPGSSVVEHNGPAVEPDSALEPDPEDGAMADDEDEVAPESPVQPVEEPVKSTTKSPAKKPAKVGAKTSPKSPTKPTIKATTKATTKVPAKRGRKPKKQLPPEKPTRISNRVSKPPRRTAAQTTTEPKPVATKQTGARKKVASKASDNRRTSSKEWEIEAIVGSMIDETHEHFYEVKWKGFSSKENTWEPKINLANCQAAIRKFEDGGNKRGKRK